MRRGNAWIVVLATCSFLVGCDGAEGVIEPTPTGMSESPSILAGQIGVDELPGTFDESRTFWLRSAQLQDPIGLLRQLWASGIRPTRAWQPLDNPMCMDPLGPTFTVELESDDPRIHDYGFDRGVGRLFCATILTEYTIHAAGQAR